MVVDLASPDKAVVPEIICDHCSGKIYDGKQAFVLYPVWLYDDRQEFGAVSFVHDRCSGPYKLEAVASGLELDVWFEEDIQGWLPRVGFSVLPVHDRKAILDVLDRLR
jgi:hypothetical protein